MNFLKEIDWRNFATFLIALVFVGSVGMAFYQADFSPVLERSKLCSDVGGDYCLWDETHIVQPIIIECEGRLIKKGCVATLITIKGAD